MFESWILALWYILPAFFSNATPIFLHGKTPIDLNLNFLDGKRLFGKGKTIKGFIFSVLIGVLVGSIQGTLEGNPTPRATLALFLAVGAMSGDAIGSFIKRRFNVKSGAATPLLDQWDFVLGAFAFTYFFREFIPIPFPETETLLFILVLTAIVHVIANVVAYKLKLKKVPW